MFTTTGIQKQSKVSFYTPELWLLQVLNLTLAS